MWLDLVRNLEDLGGIFYRNTVDLAADFNYCIPGVLNASSSHEDLSDMDVEGLYSLENSNIWP